jgi:hypothetical protein
MSLGSGVRALLGARLARRAGRAYRSIFVDLDKEARALAEVLPANAHVLDVGGGDGEPLNHLLARRADLRITTIDPGDGVGRWIEAGYAARVTCLPRTTLEAYLASRRVQPDALLIADVMHHIPVDARHAFLKNVLTLLERKPALRIVVKDVEPGFVRSVLGYWSDRYVTGDRSVSPISRKDLVALFESVLGHLQHVEARLFADDRPNYVLVFFR